MKFLFAVITLTAVLGLVSSAKTVTKPDIDNQPKKTETDDSKETSIESIVDTSDDKVSEKDDKEFLKEIEKQFELHGDSVAIEIKADKSVVSKNSKRTIDSHLGYGGYSGQFHFSKPKFMIYPYSQSDIPALHSTENVQVQKSKAYELQTSEISYQQPSVSEHVQHIPQYNLQYQQPRVVPVIVLRVPGPPEYAAHLQQLLQAYVLARAQNYVQHQLQVAQQVQPSYGIPLGQPIAHYQQQVYEAPQQQYVTYDPQYYPQQSQAVQEQPQQYEDPAQHVQQIQYVSSAAEAQPASAQSYEPQVQTQTHEQLPTSENFPSDTHTQVVFNSNEYKQQKEVVQAYHTPSQIYEQPEQQYTVQQQIYYAQSPQEAQSAAGHSEHGHEYIRQQQAAPEPRRQPQKSGHETAPYNYHAHSPQNSRKRESPFTSEQFKKYSKLISKLKGHQKRDH